MKIQLLRADVTSMKVDAMVTASQAPDSRGGANLLARFVIHAEVPSPDGADADGDLRRATTRVLQRAEDLAVASVGVPPLWFGTPELLDRCARNMLQAAIDYRASARSLQRVVFCLFGKPAHDAFDRALRELEP